ncbi:MAG: carboxylesterase/lipase family protein [Actinobacteria bacterium]|nr:carboxylesterase/lipase family protein [Actinomycetota bacterium]
MAETPNLEVSTTAGVVRGHAAAAGVVAFRGIPYAASTAGPGRFAPPSPAPPWDGVRDAAHSSPIAPQNPSMLERMLGGRTPASGEDCLALNVVTPACDDGGRPVMVWIHGGGFETGSGATPWYNGHSLARRGVVVVTLNYRLGALGFLHLGGPGRSEAPPGTGNLGILDQVAALEWVRDNIAGFGGDPANVTVFGESAGAMSVGVLLALPAADGLFRRAVLQSGAASHVHTAESAAEIAGEYLAELGEDPDAPDLLERLRARPVADLLAAQGALGARRSGAGGLVWRPVVDGIVVPEHPLARIAAGSARRIEVLLGTTLEEMTMFLLLDPALAELDAARLERRASRLFDQAGVPAGAALAAYRERFPGDGDARDAWVAMLTDATFRLPAIRLAERLVETGAKVRMYLFAHRSTAFDGALGSCHALEIPFVWDDLDATGVAPFTGPPTDEARRLATRMADCWTAFARTGEPVADGVPAWPAYDPERRATMWFDAPGVEVVDDPLGAERRVWDGAAFDDAHAV